MFYLRVLLSFLFTAVKELNALAFEDCPNAPTFPQLFGFNDDGLTVNQTNLTSIDYSSYQQLIVTGGFIEYQDSDSRVPNWTQRYCMP